MMHDGSFGRRNHEDIASALDVRAQRDEIARLHAHLEELARCAFLIDAMLRYGDMSVAEHTARRHELEEDAEEVAASLVACVEELGRHLAAAESAFEERVDPWDVERSVR